MKKYKINSFIINWCTDFLFTKDITLNITYRAINNNYNLKEYINIGKPNLLLKEDNIELIRIDYTDKFIYFKSMYLPIDFIIEDYFYSINSAKQYLNNLLNKFLIISRL